VPHAAVAAVAVPAPIAGAGLPGLLLTGGGLLSWWRRKRKLRLQPDRKRNGCTQSAGVLLGRRSG
jgi:LPXTG-motif cell wall-anchored protein